MNQEKILNLYNSATREQKDMFIKEAYKTTPKMFNNEVEDLMVSVYDLEPSVITGAVKKHMKTTRWNTKNPNFIQHYRNDRFTPIKSKQTRRDKSHHLIELLRIKYQIPYKEINTLISAMGAVSQVEWGKGLEWSKELYRYSPDTGGSYSKLKSKTKSMFFEEFTYIGAKKEKLIGYRHKEDKSELLYNIEVYLIECERQGNTDGWSGKKPENYLQIILDDFIKMKLEAQIQLLKSVEYVTGFILHTNMQEKNDVGNCGRKTNIVNEIPKSSRSMMSNLWGVDMESAIQVILYTLVKEIDPSIELPFTEIFIEKKEELRLEVQELMGYKDINQAKKYITSIFQGLPKYKGTPDEIIIIFSERNKIFKTIMSQRNNQTKVSKYAVKRTNMKMKEKGIHWSSTVRTVEVKEYETIKKNRQDARERGVNKIAKEADEIIMEIEKSFVYFYWTYYEREIQNIIAQNFRYPKTLHDAVYTQNKEEFENIDLFLIEKQISEETGIPIKLGLESP